MDMSHKNYRDIQCEYTISDSLIFGIEKSLERLAHLQKVDMEISRQISQMVSEISQAIENFDIDSLRIKI